MTLSIGSSGYSVSNASATDFTTIFGNTDGLNATRGTASFTGTNDTGDVNGTAVYEGANTSVNIIGNDDTNNAGATDFTGTFGNDDVLDASGGQASFTGIGDTGNLSGRTVYEGANSSLNVAGGSDTIDLTSTSDYLGLLGGSGYTVTGSDDKIDTIPSTNFTLDGSSDSFAGSDDAIVLNGSYDDISANGAGDYVTGSDDSDPDGSGTSGGDPDDYPDDGDDGLIAGAPVVTNVVAQYDVSIGDTTAAAAADPTVIAAPSAFEGGAWSGPVVTWSFATSSGSASAPISGGIQGQYQAVIEQALQTWADATGLTFKEVPASAASDVLIGWGNFDTSASGVVGYTNYATSGGQLQSGVVVRLQDPSQDALVSGASGALIYSGTSTSLYQVALHEIGHALGLAESSDPHSVMFPELGSANTTLDSTDLSNIAALYAKSPGATTIGLLTQAMAGFDAPPAATIASMAAASPAAVMTLAAHMLH